MSKFGTGRLHVLAQVAVSDFPNSPDRISPRIQLTAWHPKFEEEINIIFKLRTLWYVSWDQRGEDTRDQQVFLIISHQLC